MTAEGPISFLTKEGILMEIKVINREVIMSRGYFYRLRIWIEGWTNGINGQFTMGLTGKETVIEVDAFRPPYYFKAEQDNGHESI